MPPSDSFSFRRWSLSIRVLLIGAAVAVFIFLARRPSPSFTELWWMPRSFARWADYHGVARNVVGFFGFGLVCFAFVGRRWPQLAGAAAFATILEVVQIWIPHRVFDLKDICASLLGLALGWLVIAGCANLGRRLKLAC